MWRHTGQRWVDRRRRPRFRLVPPATPSVAPAAAAGQEAAPPQVGLMNVASPEFGGHIEVVTSEADHEDRAAIHLIDRGLPEQSSWSAAAPSPQEFVIGFFERQPARISSIVFDPNTHTSARWAKDVEAWTSMESPTAGFGKVGSLTLAREDGEQTMTFEPIVGAVRQDSSAVAIPGGRLPGRSRQRSRCWASSKAARGKPSWLEARLLRLRPWRRKPIRCRAPRATRGRRPLRPRRRTAPARRCSCSRARTACIRRSGTRRRTLARTPRRRSSDA